MYELIPVAATVMATVRDASCSYLSHLDLKVGEQWTIKKCIAATKFTDSAWCLVPFTENTSDDRFAVIPAEDVYKYFNLTIDLETTPEQHSVGAWSNTSSTLKVLTDGPISITVRNR